MAKKKWYVVIVGKEIGVFDTWIDVGPIVKGVPEAVHQSFTTREEAFRVYTEAQAKGTTRIVNPDNPTPNRRQGAPMSHGSSVQTSRANYPPRSYFSDSPTTRTRATSHIPSRADSAPTTRNVRSQLSSPITRSSSEPTPSEIRLRLIQVALDEKAASVGGEAGATSTSLSTPVVPAPASPPPAEFPSPRSLHATRSRLRSEGSRATSVFSSPSVKSSSDSSRISVVVKTPSWLEPYPRSSQPSSPLLSPLSMGIEDLSLSLNSFHLDVHAGGFQAESTTSTPKNVALPSPSTYQSPRQGSVGHSSIYFNSPVHPPPHRRVNHDIDPRSPILEPSQVPELAYASVMSFARPSPQVKHKPLLASPLSSSMGSISSSLLLSRPIDREEA